MESFLKYLAKFFAFFQNLFGIKRPEENSEQHENLLKNCDDEIIYSSSELCETQKNENLKISDQSSDSLDHQMIFKNQIPDVLAKISHKIDFGDADEVTTSETISFTKLDDPPTKIEMKMQELANIPQKCEPVVKEIFRENIKIDEIPAKTMETPNKINSTLEKNQDIQNKKLFMADLSKKLSMKSSATPIIRPKSQEIEKEVETEPTNVKLNDEVIFEPTFALKPSGALGRRLPSLRSI